jgi:signal peptide peptidase SppA
MYQEIFAILPEALHDPRYQREPGPASTASRSGGVIRILPLMGSLSQRWGRASTIEGFTKMFRAAMTDSSVKAIVINVDSPGGSIYGVDEMANEIRRARGQKRIVAIANSMAASAAYWIASAADEFAVTPGGEVGSIGVIGSHTDRSRKLEQEGLKMTIISAGKYKTEDSSYAPLSDEARAAMKARIDSYYSMFVTTVAENRHTTATRVHTTYGRGRMLTAKDALKAGMVDRVATLDQVLAKLGVTGSARTAARSL